MKTITVDSVLTSVNQAHHKLGYSQAGFNIHDCSDSMHEVHEHAASIDALLGLLQKGDLSEKDLAAMDREYVKGYASYALDHNVFSKKLSKKRNESDELTPVSSSTDVDFESPKGWALFCDIYAELAAAKAAKPK